jgi:hypothetical protein
MEAYTPPPAEGADVPKTTDRVSTFFGYISQGWLCGNPSGRVHNTVNAYAFGGGRGISYDARMGNSIFYGTDGMVKGFLGIDLYGGVIDATSQPLVNYLHNPAAAVCIYGQFSHSNITNYNSFQTGTPLNFHLR